MFTTLRRVALATIALVAVGCDQPKPTVATMRLDGCGIVKWTYIHVDEAYNTWLDQDAPVYDGRQKPGEAEKEDMDLYLSIQKTGLGNCTVSIFPHQKFRWTPSPKPAGKRFVPLGIIDRSRWVS